VTAAIRRITVAEAVSVHVLVMARDVGVRDVGLLESALARPYAVLFGHEVYPDSWLRAAALYHSLLQNHPFLDGNKRIAVVLALALLEIEAGVDVLSRAAEQEDPFFDLTMAVAAGELSDVEKIAARLRSIIAP
jgi:death on curing protein